MHCVHHCLCDCEYVIPIEERKFEEDANSEGISNDELVVGIILVLTCHQCRQLSLTPPLSHPNRRLLALSLPSQ